MGDLLGTMAGAVGVFTGTNIDDIAVLTAANQGWYSYNLGNWHVITLNVECNSAAFHNDCSTSDSGLLAQETQRLANELKNNKAPCTVAYWHQPTFSATTDSTATVPASARSVAYR